MSFTLHQKHVKDTDFLISKNQMQHIQLFNHKSKWKKKTKKNVKDWNWNMKIDSRRATPRWKFKFNNSNQL